jgi:hypothetical protein
MKTQTHNDVRGFGVVMLVASLLLAWRLRSYGTLVLALCIGTGALLGLASFVAPALVRPLARAWATLGHLLGRITTPILLVLVFVLVVIPLRGVLAVFRIDPLALRFDRNAKTHFITRKKPQFDRADFERLS